MCDMYIDLKCLALLQLMNEYEKFCVEEAEYHLQRARELLTEGLKDPKKYHDESKEFYKMLAKVLPFMVWIQHNESLHHDPETEGNLSDTPSSSQSDSSSYEPESHSDH
jgi:hypothetical protein